MENNFKFTITIADILIMVNSSLSVADIEIEDRLVPFFCEPENPIDRVYLAWKESKDSPVICGEMIYDPGSIWKMYRAGEIYYAALTYKHEEVQCVLRANASWDDLKLTELHTGIVCHSLINIGIVSELFLRTKILLTDGLVFHASAIDDNGRGIVFVGHSGEGKSTQAHLWNHIPDSLLINEDRVAVRSCEGGAICYGTPWGGSAKITHNHQVPLSVLILLEQASENEIKQLSPSIAAPLLLARTFLPYWDGTLMQHAFENLNKILASVPVYLLRCRPEPKVFSLVRSVL